MNAQRVLITGCSSGIGLATACHLAARGHRVIASARSMQDVERLRHIGLQAVLLDVADSRSVRQGVADALAITNGLDVLFSNAGFGLPGAVENLTRDALREQFETNLFGMIEVINEVMPVFRAQGHGRLINNSSVLGLVALPMRGAYAATKFAIEAMSDALRLELRGSGIVVSLIEPGPILTKFRANSLAAFERHISAQSSVHAAAYATLHARLVKEGAAQPFTLPALAVARKVQHAVEAPRPRRRYYVTFPTYLFATLKRLLPPAWLDAFAARIR